MRTPVRQAFSYGIQHVFIVICQIWVTVHWITMKTCRIPNMKLPAVRESAFSLIPKVERPSVYGTPDGILGFICTIAFVLRVCLWKGTPAPFVVVVVVVVVVLFLFLFFYVFCRVCIYSYSYPSLHSNHHDDDKNPH